MAISRLVVGGDRLRFSADTNKTQPLSFIPPKARFLFTALIDMDRSLFKPFHQGNENRKAGRRGRFPAPCLALWAVLGLWPRSHYWDKLSPKPRTGSLQTAGITWPSKEFLCKHPITGSPSTSVLLSSKQRYLLLSGRH